MRFGAQVNQGKLISPAQEIEVRWDSGEWRLTLSVDEGCSPVCSMRSNAIFSSRAEGFNNPGPGSIF